MYVCHITYMYTHTDSELFCYINNRIQVTLNVVVSLSPLSRQVKLKLPIRLNTSHHLLFTFYHVACDVAKGGKSTKSSIKLPPVESAGVYNVCVCVHHIHICMSLLCTNISICTVGFAWLPLMDTTGR